MCLQLINIIVYDLFTDVRNQHNGVDHGCEQTNNHSDNCLGDNDDGIKYPIPVEMASGNT